MAEITYRQAVNLALREEMRRDPTVILFGEDVGRYGGAFKVTEGLFEEFGPERVLDAPLAEAGIAGTALGAALTGMRPVAEIMYIDFCTIALDQIVNQAAKIRYMSGGQVSVPLVIRTQSGSGRSSAAQHAQSLEAWLCHAPGLLVIMPSDPASARGLLKSAIRENNPVVFIEHKLLYNMKGDVPDDGEPIPLGKARILREGNDCTVVATSTEVAKAMGAADTLADEGIEVEIIDPMTLVPLDIDTIFSSVRKTGHLVIAHEACERAGFGGEIATRVGELAFDYLDAPIARVATPPVPSPFAPILESAILPNAAQIADAVRRICLRGNVNGRIHTYQAGTGRDH
ncbi:MAG: alpha-ketoacid dehydrogenase subunit beta [Armatimonadetes bacterium]|nr:alpha-ketoacid dehydrogenase subunit beta [Armatimonadota bacterium]